VTDQPTLDGWDRELIERQLADHARGGREPDPLGKAALFSVTAPKTGALGMLTVECSVCRRETPLRLRELPRLLMPFAITLPRRYHTFMKCPGCGRRAWVRAHWRL
jgi:uncharacterized protein with PIN domain